MIARHDYWNLWLHLLGKELKAKYKGMALGYLWSLLLPLCQSIVFLVVFNRFLRFPIKDYFLFLTIGFVIWQFFANSIICGATVLINNGNLVKKTTCPRLIFIAASVGAELIHLLVSMPLLLLFALICSRFPAWSSLYLLLVGTLSVVLFTFGIAVLVALSNVFFRDLERLLQVLLQIWFYVTPIFYSMEQIPKCYHHLFLWNPVFIPLKLFRSVFYAPENCGIWSLISLLAGLLFCSLAIAIFNRHEKGIAEQL